MSEFFKQGLGSYTYDGDTIEATRDGFRFVATVHHDSDHGAPWEECHGHGPVSDWRTAGYSSYCGHIVKRPGELLLCEDRGCARFYDFAEACRIALRDGWGWQPGKLVTARNSGRVWNAWFEGVQGPYGTSEIDGDVNQAIRALYASHRATMSPREYAARAARHDFEILRAWCNNDWNYCGVAVQVFDSQGEELTGEYDFALWGIEMNYPKSDNEYLRDVANQLACEAWDSVVLPLMQSAATVQALQSAGI